MGSSVAAVIKLHECLLSRATKVLDAKLAYLDNSREVDEWVEAAEVWIAAKSRETLSCLEHHPLKSSAIKSQIMQVQSGLICKHESLFLTTLTLCIAFFLPPRV